MLMSLSFSGLPYATSLLALVDTTICVEVQIPAFFHFPRWKRLLCAEKICEFACRSK